MSIGHLRRKAGALDFAEPLFGMLYSTSGSFLQPPLRSETFGRNKKKALVSPRGEGKSTPEKAACPHPSGSACVAVSARCLGCSGRHTPASVAGGWGCSYTDRTVLRQLPERTTFIGRIRKDAKPVCALPPASATPSGGRPRRYGALAPTPEQVLHDDSVPPVKVRCFAAGEVQSRCKFRPRFTGARPVPICRCCWWRSNLSATVCARAPSCSTASPRFRSAPIRNSSCRSCCKLRSTAGRSSAIIVTRNLSSVRHRARCGIHWRSPACRNSRSPLSTTAAMEKKAYPSFGLEPAKSVARSDFARGVQDKPTPNIDDFAALAPFDANAPNPPLGSETLCTVAA